MSDKLITAIPALPGYFVSRRRSATFNTPADPWGPWALVIGWGFSAYDSRPAPLSLKGAPDADYEEWRIKTPEGEVVEA